MSVIKRNTVLKIDSLALLQHQTDSNIEIEVSTDKDNGKGIEVLQFLKSNLGTDYIQWTLTSDYQYAMQVDYEGLKIINLHLKALNAEHSMFGITCCGASINKDCQLSLVGDFLGSAHLFDNRIKNAQEGSP
jgi:hypothetical protein